MAGVPSGPPRPTNISTLRCRATARAAAIAALPPTPLRGQTPWRQRWHWLPRRPRHRRRHQRQRRRSDSTTPERRSGRQPQPPRPPPHQSTTHRSRWRRRRRRCVPPRMAICERPCRRRAVSGVLARRPLLLPTHLPITAGRAVSPATRPHLPRHHTRPHRRTTAPPRRRRQARVATGRSGGRFRQAQQGVPPGERRQQVPWPSAAPRTPPWTDDRRGRAHHPRPPRVRVGRRRRPTARRRQSASAPTRGGGGVPPSPPRRLRRLWPLATVWAEGVAVGANSGGSGDAKEVGRRGAVGCHGACRPRGGHRHPDSGVVGIRARNTRVRAWPATAVGARAPAPTPAAT